MISKRLNCELFLKKSEPNISVNSAYQELWCYKYFTVCYMQEKKW